MISPWFLFVCGTMNLGTAIDKKDGYGIFGAAVVVCVSLIDLLGA